MRTDNTDGRNAEHECDEIDDKLNAVHGVPFGLLSKKGSAKRKRRFRWPMSPMFSEDRAVPQNARVRLLREEEK
jgi:hypothetical protein